MVSHLCLSNEALALPVANMHSHFLYLLFFPNSQIRLRLDVRYYAYHNKLTVPASNNNGANTTNINYDLFQSVAKAIDYIVLSRENYA